MKLRRISKLFICSSLYLITLATNAKTVNLPGAQGTVLPNVLVEAAFKRGGVYKVNYPHKDQSINFSRQLSNTDAGEYQVMWTTTTPEFEKRFIPVRIPIYKGMIGMRVGIVRKDRADLFSSVKNLQQLNMFKAGQGTFWADTAVLEANQIPVVKEVKYFNLFPMLEGGRYDYFPRGVFEPWSEIEREAKYNLTVEPNVLIRYKMPFYYFVSKQNPEIAIHLREQLEAMIKDGTFDKLFLADNQVKVGLENSDLSKRTIIDIVNPNLPDATPLDRAELWYDPLTAVN